MGPKANGYKEAILAFQTRKGRWQDLLFTKRRKNFRTGSIY